MRKRAGTTRSTGTVPTTSGCSRRPEIYGTGDARLALEVLDRDLGNIRAAQTWAAVTAVEKRRARLCLAYGSVNDRVVRLRFPARQRIAWLTLVVESTVNPEQIAAQLSCLYNLAIAHEEVCDYLKAVACADEMRRQARKAGRSQRLAEARACERLAGIYVYLGRHQLPRRWPTDAG